MNFICSPHSSVRPHGALLGCRSRGAVFDIADCAAARSVSRDDCARARHLALDAAQRADRAAVAEEALPPPTTGGSIITPEFVEQVVCSTNDWTSPRLPITSRSFPPWAFRARTASRTSHLSSVECCHLSGSTRRTSDAYSAAGRAPALPPTRSANGQRRSRTCLARADSRWLP